MHPRSKLKPRALATSLLAVLCLAGANAQSQEAASAYPSKPVTFVIPNVSGGTTDTEIRIYSQRLTESLGKPFLIDYKPGAGGIVGGVAVAKAAPDGYTLLVATSSFTVTPAFSTDMPYDTIKDFAPVSLMTRRPTVLVAHPDFPPNNLVEYMAYVKANPNKVFWGTSGVGGGHHLAGVWLHSEFKGAIQYIHYKGSAQMYPDLMSGRIQVHPGSLQTAMTNIRNGKTKPIAIMSLNRVAQLPDVKTAVEQGIEDFEQPSYLGIVAPARTPAPIVNKMSAELAKLAKNPDVAKRFEADGTVMVGSTPAQFAQFISKEIPRWIRLVKENNIKQE